MTTIASLSGDSCGGGRRKRRREVRHRLWELDGWARTRGRRERGATLPSLPREDAREEDEEDDNEGASAEKRRATSHLRPPQTVLSRGGQVSRGEAPPRAPPSPRKGGAGSRGGVVCGPRSRPRILASRVSSSFSRRPYHLALFDRSLIMPFALLCLLLFSSSLPLFLQTRALIFAIEE